MPGVHETVADVNYTYPISAEGSIWGADAHNLNINECPNWGGLLGLDISPVPFQDRGVDGQTSTEASFVTGKANPAGQAWFMNPWTQQYEQLSIEDADSSSTRSEPPKKKTASRKSERRRAQNREAQRKFTARKLERENDLVDRIAELEMTISRLGSENRELNTTLENLKHLQRSGVHRVYRGNTQTQAS